MKRTITFCVVFILFTAVFMQASVGGQGNNIPFVRRMQSLVFGQSQEIIDANGATGQSANADMRGLENSVQYWKHQHQLSKAREVKLSEEYQQFKIDSAEKFKIVFEENEKLKRSNHNLICQQNYIMITLGAIAISGTIVGYIISKKS